MLILILEFLSGNIVHGFLEYIVHRYLHGMTFLSSILSRNKRLCKSEYDEMKWMHSEHHKENDSSTIGALVECGLCGIIIYTCPYYRQFIGGLLVGYSTYKLYHIVSHRKSCIPDFSGSTARIYHKIHHNNTFYRYNFGVTTVIYDYLFNTLKPHSLTPNWIGLACGSIPLLCPLTFKYGLYVKTRKMNSAIVFY